jgi:hypothetical protein
LVTEFPFLLQMDFLKKDSFNSFAVSPTGNPIGTRILTTFDATGIVGRNFRVVCAASKPASFFFSGAYLYMQPKLACFKFIVEIEPEDLYFPHNFSPPCGTTCLPPLQKNESNSSIQLTHRWTTAASAHCSTLSWTMRMRVSAGLSAHMTSCHSR